MELEIFVAESNEVDLGKYVVARVKNVRSKGEKYGPDDIDEIYEGDTSHASMLYGWGIARHIATKTPCLMIFNPSQRVTFPPCEE